MHREMPPAHKLTRAVFGKDPNRLRKLHGVDMATAYKYMQECGCHEHEGFGSGRPCTLHRLEKEIREGLDVANDAAKANGGVPDYSDLRRFTHHPAHFLTALLQEQSKDGFDSEESRCEKLKRIVSEHADVVRSGISREPDAKQLEEGEQLLAAVEDYVDCMRGEVRVQARLRMIDEKRAG